MNPNQNDELAEQLLDSKGERPKGHVLKAPKKPTAEEKEKVAKQGKAIQDDLGK
jgi:preprotein translocase subunit Sss1